MKNETLKPLILLACAAALPLALPNLACASASTERYFVDPHLPTEVQAAHDAFLRGDFKELGTALKVALLAHPGDSAVQADLLELYDKALELKGDHAIPADWKFPEGTSFLNVASKIRYDADDGSIRHRISIYGEYATGQEVEQVQITHYPGEVLLDKQAGIGEYEAGTDDGKPNYWFGGEYRSAPNAEGLYLLTLQMKGQEPVQGWFILSRMNATESPELRIPSANQAFSTGTPSFAWNDFVSPQYRSFEKRKVYASVVLRGPDVRDNTWAVNIPAPVSSATVGAGLPEETGVKSLAKGDYMFSVSYRERHHFGDLVLSRESATVMPFSVR